MSGDVPPTAPNEVRQLAAERRGPRAPSTDPTLGVPLARETAGEPTHRLVLIGDSLTHGFQSGAIFNTDLSYGAIVAYELGWLGSYRYPRYPGRGGLPLNIELLLRWLERHVGATISVWELPEALFVARQFMDDVEDYWERGRGSAQPPVQAINHALAMYGWDLRDALEWTAATLRQAIHAPKDDPVAQVVENNAQRAALRVYPSAPDDADLNLFGAAARLGDETDDGSPGGTDNGIETLVVFLGSNNALQSVTNLKVVWSDTGYDDPQRKGAYTAWRPEHFRAELAHVAEAVRGIKARHVIWCTVPHVTIAPIARGVGEKLRTGSRYFPYYTRPWIPDQEFSSRRDPHITGAEARAVDYAIDLYNADIEAVVRTERRGGGPDKRPRDWYLLDVAGMLDRLASRRYINDPNARPDWWTPYPLPPALKALDPGLDSRFLTSDGRGGRATGGLFSLDGVHPTTVGYGLLAQEIIDIMQLAGVTFRHPTGVVRQPPVRVDFERLILRDTLVRFPPQNIRSTLDVLAWGDQALDLVRQTLSFRA